jgi:nucleotide-binding universal stress UspA family protein
MLKKVLVPVDGSDESKHVLPYVSYLAGKFDFTVHLLGVGIGSKRRRVNQLLDDYLNEVSADLHAENIKAEIVMRYGRPAEEILAYNESDKFDLILMTTHGRGGITRWWIGSVAEQVVCESPTPVLLIRSKAEESFPEVKKVSFDNILVPLDGSEIGETALPYVEELAAKTDSCVTLMHVIPAHYTFDPKAGNDNGNNLNESTQKASEEYLHGIAGLLEQRSIRAICKVGNGDPANVVVDYAGENNIGLIAMSTHGRSGVARWVLGSVADKVLHESETPLWLVRSSKMVISRKKE